MYTEHFEELELAISLGNLFFTFLPYMDYPFEYMHSRINVSLSYIQMYLSLCEKRCLNVRRIGKIVNS